MVSSTDFTDYADLRKDTTDLVCFAVVTVELKTRLAVSGVDYDQVLNYLKTTGSEIALLTNFESKLLKFNRLIVDRYGTVPSA